MQVVMLNFEPSLQRLMRMLFESESYSFTSTMDPDEALRALEASAKPCILITDNFNVNPTSRDTLTRLRANPELQGKVWIIILDSANPFTQSNLDQGLMDEWFPLPFRTEELFALLDRIQDRLA